MSKDGMNGEVGVRIVTLGDCDYCIWLKNELDGCGITYINVDAYQFPDFADSIEQKFKTETYPIVFIDLGTSISTLSYFDKNNIFHIITDNNSHNISSIVSFTQYGNIFGNKVKDIKDNNIFISNIKRLIGYKYNDLDKSYYELFNGVSIINNNDNIGIVINDKIYTPDEIMIYFLNYLKQLINNEIKEPYKVIVTVPAYFNIQQKEAINNCVFLAGFDLIKLLS